MIFKKSLHDLTHQRHAVRLAAWEGCMTEGAKAFGARLRAAREAKGMSQAELAEAAGVPVGSLRGWEQGRREPLASAVALLGDGLGLTPGELASLLGCRLVGD